MQQITTNNTDDTLACLLIPMKTGRVLLPNVTVAELTAFDSINTLDNTPEWLLGSFEWRGTNIPVVSYEEFSGQSAGATGQDVRIAVLNAPSGETGELRFFGLLVQGIPSLVKLEEHGIKENHNTQLSNGQKMSVTLETGHAIIPDLDAIEGAILELDGIRF